MATKNVRLATWIAPDASKRLRTYAFVRGLKISEALTQVLRQALPPAAELAKQVSRNADEHAG